MRLCRDAGAAFTLLTALPIRAEAPEAGNGADVAGWFPVVGLALGVLGWGVAHLVEWGGLTSPEMLLASALLVAAWALATRMLHWDGLADVADGFWGSHDRERRLEIMSDSHTGAFGAAAVSLTAIVEVTAIAAIVTKPHQLPLLVVPLFARLAATFAAWLGKPAKPGGLGRTIMGRPTAAGVAVAVLAAATGVGGLIYGYEWHGVVFAAVALLTAAAVPHLLSQRFGGVTGDVMGASVLLTETLLFVVFALGL